MSPLFLSLKDYQCLPTFSHHYSPMTGCSSLSVLTRSLTQSTLFPVLCSGLGKGPGAALQGTVCGGGIPWNLPLYSSTFDCMLSYNEVSRESFKCPGFFSSSKTIPFPQIHKGSTLPTLPFSSVSRDHQFHALGERTQARPAVSWGTDPGPQQRMMLCGPLNNSKLFCSFLTVLLFDILFLIQKSLEMGSRC